MIVLRGGVGVTPKLSETLSCATDSEGPFREDVASVPVVVSSVNLWIMAGKGCLQCEAMRPCMFAQPGVGR